MLNVEQLIEVYGDSKHHTTTHKWEGDMYVFRIANGIHAVAYGASPTVVYGFSKDGLGWWQPRGTGDWIKLVNSFGRTLSKQHSKTRIGEQLGTYKGRQKLLCIACLPNGNEHVYNWVEKIYQQRPEMFEVFNDTVRMGKVTWSKQDVQNLQRVHDRLVEEQNEREMIEANSRPFVLLPEIDGWKRIESGSELKALAKEFKNCCFGYLDDCVEGDIGFYRVVYEGQKICVAVDYRTSIYGDDFYEVREAKLPCNKELSIAHSKYICDTVERLNG